MGEARTVALMLRKATGMERLSQATACCRTGGVGLPKAVGAQMVLS